VVPVSTDDALANELVADLARVIRALRAQLDPEAREVLEEIVTAYGIEVE
jgi:hypothetical protein